MAPPKSSSRIQDDLKSETSGAKAAGAGNSSTTKMRRNASQQSHAPAREVAQVPASTPLQTVNEVIAPTLHWSTFERDVLHAYRRKHNITTPASFMSTYHQRVLSQPAGIGLYSPTMVRKRGSRRQGKDQLATAVRKHFNGVGIQENDVIVDFICRLRSERSLRSTGPTRQEASNQD